MMHWELRVFTLFIALIIGSCLGLPRQLSSRNGSNPDWNKEVFLKNRIFGGDEALEGQFPYMASLRMAFKNKWIHVCGGSIITEQWILTAAHCLREREAQDMRVFLGTITTKGDGDVYEPELFIMHESFSLQPVRNDIGLIKLKEKIKFTNNVKAIRISNEYVGDNVTGVACGFGFYKEGSSETPDIMQYLNQVTLTNEDCAPKVNSNNFYENNLCAFNRHGVGMCNGDSGSPLVANNQQIGIASWVKLPCASGKPDVYLRPTDYLSWISLQVYTNSKIVKDETTKGPGKVDNDNDEYEDFRPDFDIRMNMNVK